MTKLPRFFPSKSCDENPFFFPKRFVEMLSWMQFFGLCWPSCHPFGVIMDVLGVQMGFFLNDFEGLVPFFGALVAQSVPGTPCLR